MSKSVAWLGIGETIRAEAMVVPSSVMLGRDAIVTAAPSSVKVASSRRTARRPAPSRQ